MSRPSRPSLSQSAPTKILFICSRNKIRSLTAERLFDAVPGYVARSAGTQPGARIVVTKGHLGWADVIVVMEKSHLSKLRRKFSTALESKEVITLHIPVNYTLMDDALLDELRSKLSLHLRLPDHF